MIRLVLLVVLTLVAVGVALLLQRRRPEAPSAPTYRAPTQVDRDDFASPEVPTLLAIFTSATCDSCAKAVATAHAVTSGRQAMAVQEIEIQEDPSLHQRYKIDGVPTVLIIDAQGVVIDRFFGPPTEDQLAAVLPGA